MKKIPLLLYTYLLTEMLAPFFAALLVINAILFLGRLIPLLDSIFGLGVGLADFIRLCLYLTPSLLRFSIPMAAMLAVVIAFTRMRNDLEIMALKASGVGLLKMLPPVLFFGLATALLTLVTGTSLVPKGMVAMNHLMANLAKERIEQGVRPQTFSEGLSGVVLYIEEVSPVDGGWRGVYLSDLREPGDPLTILARSGSLRADGTKVIMTLNEGSMHRSSGQVSQTIHFQQYNLEIPLHPPAIGQLGRSSMTGAQLMDRAAELGPDHPHYHRFFSEYHQRLVLAGGCFLLSILGLSLSQLGQGSRLALGVPLSLLAFITYYILLTFAKSVAEEGRLPVAVAMWGPNLAFLLLTAHLLYRNTLELGNPRLEQAILWLQESWQKVWPQSRGGQP